MARAGEFFLVCRGREDVRIIDDPTPVWCPKFPFSWPDRPCAGRRSRSSPTQFVALLTPTRNYYLRRGAAIGRSVHRDLFLTPRGRIRCC